MKPASNHQSSISFMFFIILIVSVNIANGASGGDPSPEANYKVHKVAILEFFNINDSAKKDNKGRIVSEVFTTFSSEFTCFQLVERHLIRKLFDEMEFGKHEIQGSDAQKIGTVLEADAILTGSISEIMGKLRVDARLINVESGKIIQTAGGTCTVDLDNITRLVSELSEKLFATLQGNCERYLKLKTSKVDLSLSLESLMQLSAAEVLISSNKESFKLGEKMILTFIPNAKGFLTIFNYTEGDDDITVLFPNKYNQDNSVLKGQKVTFPTKKDGFELIAQPPVGNSHVVALLTLQKLNLTAKWEGGDIFKSLKQQGARAFSLDVKNTNAALGVGKRIVVIHD